MHRTRFAFAAVCALMVGGVSLAPPADHTRICIVTKTFTGTAPLQLVDQGRIQLRDPISQYIVDIPAGEQITLDMTGRMRSGLYDYSEDEAWVYKLFAESADGPAPKGMRR